MAGKPNNSSFSEEKAGRLHRVLMVLMIALILGAAGTHYAIVDQQKSLLEEMVALKARPGDIEQQNADITALLAAGQRQIDIFVKISINLYALMLAILIYESFFLVGPTLQMVARQREYVEKMAAVDMLTGSYNRATLFKIAAMLIGSAKRYKQAMTVLAIDIDELEKINNKYGRAAGDAAIRTVAKTLAGVLRNSDVMGRVGGGEFGVFLPATDENQAGYVAEKLRAAVEDVPFATQDSVILLRVSLGMAEIQEKHKSPDDMLRAAELALRCAKNNGRNRVVSSTAAQVKEAAAAGVAPLVRA